MNIEHFDNYSTALFFVNFACYNHTFYTAFEASCGGRYSLNTNFDYNECTRGLGSLGVYKSIGQQQLIQDVLAANEMDDFESLKGTDHDDIITLYEMVNFGDITIDKDYIKGVKSFLYFFSNFDYKKLNKTEPFKNKDAFMEELQRQIKIINERENVNDVEYSQ